LKAKELIEKLQALDPETEIFAYDREWGGGESIEDLRQIRDHYYLGTDKLVWVLLPEGIGQHYP
jgi:hypothetical protein